MQNDALMHREGLKGFNDGNITLFKICGDVVHKCDKKAVDRYRCIEDKNVGL